MSELPVLYVDADACPVRSEIVTVAERYALVTTFIANSGLRPSRNPKVRHVMVSDRFDAADDWIVEHAGERDIVVTADMLLAERVVANGALCLTPSGKLCTKSTMGLSVAMRNLNQHLRETGAIAGHVPAFTKRDRSRFSQMLDKTVRQALNSAT